MMKCPNCGNEIEENKNFCTNCGTKLELNKKINLSLKKIIIIIAVVLVILFIISIVVYMSNNSKPVVGNKKVSQNTVSNNSINTNSSNNTSNISYKNIDNTEIPIPNGFYYVGGTVNTGIVISDNKNDLNAGTDTDLLGNQFVWIPCTIEQFVRKDWGKQTKMNGSIYQGFASIYDDEDTEEFKNLKESISKYQGFYIGRYETSCKVNENNIVNTSLKAESKKSIYPKTTSPNFKQGTSVKNYQTGALWTSIKYDDAVKYSKNMYNNSSSVYSHLPYGTEWDRIMQWLIDTNSKTYEQIVNDSTSWGTYHKNDLSYNSGTYTSEPNNTGENSNAISNNIYDLAGNLAEWTQEIMPYGRVSRGGNYMLTGDMAPACYRAFNGEETSSGDTGFRVALFIK